MLVLVEAIEARAAATRAGQRERERDDGFSLALLGKKGRTMLGCTRADLPPVVRKFPP